MTTITHDTKNLYLDSENKSGGIATRHDHSINGGDFNGAKTVLLRSFVMNGLHNNILVGQNQLAVEHNGNLVNLQNIPIGSYTIKSFANALMIALNAIAGSTGSSTQFYYLFSDIGGFIIMNTNNEPFKILFGIGNTTLPRKYLGFSDTADDAKSNFSGELKSKKTLDIEPYSTIHLVINRSISGTNFDPTVCMPVVGNVNIDLAHITLPVFRRNIYSQMNDHCIYDALTLMTSLGTINAFPDTLTIEFYDQLGNSIIDITNLEYSIVLQFIF